MKIKDLKFRVWNGENLSYSDEYSSLEAFFGMIDVKGYFKIETEYTQWTGFRDADGFPIFEGDIVTSKPISNKGPLFIVKDRELLNDKGESFFDSGHVPNLYWEEIRIVGNIFENEEFKNFEKYK